MIQALETSGIPEDEVAALAATIDTGDGHSGLYADTRGVTIDEMQTA